MASTSTQRRPAWPAWAALGIAVAAWELFLRLDSHAITVPTKLWFFPLIAITVASAITLAGAAVERVVSRLPERMRTPAEVAALAVASAALAAAEFLGVVHYHSPESSWLWPLAAAGGLAYALGVYGIVPRGMGPAPAWRKAFGTGRASLLVLPLVAAVVLASVTVVLRSDAAACLLRTNSVLGRIAAWPLARVRSAPDTAEVTPFRAEPLRTTKPLGRRSVIVLTIDTLRTDYLSFYDPSAQPTPSIDALAARSVVFDDAWAQRPTSAPSMATFMTGMYPARHRVRDNAMVLPDDVRTLAEIHADAGFATAAFVTNINFDKAFAFDQGFATHVFFDAPTDRDGLMLDVSDEQAVDAALAWSADHTDGPIFLWVHLLAPHAPYLPPADLAPELHPGRGEWMNVLNMPFNHARVEGLRTYFDRDVYLDLYRAEVASVDREVARLMAGLDRLGLIASSHVIFAGDHGESFGEGDTFGHGHGLHAAEAHVPLTWKLPSDLRAGTRIPTTVQLADVAPTLLTLSGLEAAAGDEYEMDGRDLSGLLVGEIGGDAGFAFTDAGYAGTLGARGLTYAARTSERTIRFDTGFPYTVEYDRKLDPSEARPRSYSPKQDDRLFATLYRLTAQAETQREQGGGRVALDAEQTERLRALGYMW